MTERILDLVVPLPHDGTDMRITETTGRAPAMSGAVSRPAYRPGDVDSTTERSTRPIQTMPGTRTSTTATRTTTTPTTSCAPAPSADESHPADFSFTALVQAYHDCRRTKRNTASALEFEARLERNLCQLYDELQAGTYRPGRSICFVVTRPGSVKGAREVWAADFRDRIAHHFLYNAVGPGIEATFIADSCACIPGRGTLYAARRLEAKIRSITQNWQRPAYYLKLDIANFFVSIDKRILAGQLAERITAPEWWWLAETILFHDPRQNFAYHGAARLLARVPAHKRLTRQDCDHGLPIGNLSSQFFANIHLDDLDQFIKHRIGAHHYIRYVDDFILLHDDPRWLNAARAQIEAFLSYRLNLRLNTSKTILQPIARGVDFVGHLIKPWRRIIRRRTFHAALQRLATLPADELFEAANSTFGLLRQTGNSHADRARLANLLRRCGHCVSGDLTKTYRKPSSQEHRQ